MALMSATKRVNDSFMARMHAQLGFVTFFLRRPRQAWILIATITKKIKSPLHAEYYSMTPYQLGGDKVVRYKATPLQIPHADLPEKRSENFLHDALVAELDPTQHEPEEKAVFDFSVQVRGTATPEDVEDASLPWTRRNDETILLGRIEIPVQTFDKPDQISTCEDISFNPWNSLPEHRPLGGLNRMRLAVYLASMQVRHRLNLVVTGADQRLTPV